MGYELCIAGWLGCPAYGQAIGCIIPSKVPLGESFDQYIPCEHRYTPKHVIYQQRQLGREVSWLKAIVLPLCAQKYSHFLLNSCFLTWLIQIGLVIDLTNTNRYYPISSWSEEGIGYSKIRCVGRDSVPDDASIDKFVQQVLQFLSHQRHTKKYVLVHCTHGHNRTGYMVAHFLKRTESISVTEAINIFSRARHPGVYKQDYLDSLYRSYHELKPELVVCPRTPEWKRTSLPDFDGGVVQEATHSHENGEDRAMTNDDVLGEAIPSVQVGPLQQICYRLLLLENYNLSSTVQERGNPQFPGSHPVSLDMDNLQFLRQHHYCATWKADGTRYMMLITWDGCYLIDRKFHFRRVEMRFPCKDKTKTHNYTLLDGEMVIDFVPSSQKQERRYLIYDVMAINGISVVKFPFHERWKMIEKDVVEPRNMERNALSKSTYPSYRYDMEPFRVRRKQFYPLSTSNKLLKKFIPGLSHGADGLIFQLGVDNQHHLFLHERGKKRVMEGNRIVFNDASHSFSYSGRIIECYWDPDRKLWIFMRVRTDKSTPNEFNTYKKVMRSIRDNITEEVLLKEIDHTIRLPMYAG
ncbi:hypothetical protein Tsubulata_026289 [Turnera subulata]|uniref:mRNA guanylyltransferase n=1 Tax=Turnera subulata TaxID=218843 RepID=A0A9Q0FNT8_9ROSI|nr:hypothetical protein Tsubulata_026289 [Turnera subulata]